MTFSTFALFVLSVLFLCTLALSQLTPVPKNQFINGLVIGNPANKHHLHFTLEMTCIDCSQWYRTRGAAIFEMLANSSQIYGTVNIFPLPYHIAAFDASLAALLVRQKLNTDATLKLYANMFTNQTPIMNTKMAMLTRDQQRELIYNEYLRDLGISKADWQRHVDDTPANLQVRSEFKYAAYTGVTGTPFFQANGVIIPDGFEKDAKGWIAFFADLDAQTTEERVVGAGRAPIQL